MRSPPTAKAIASFKHPKRSESEQPKPTIYISGEGLRNYALSKLMWAMVVRTLIDDKAPREVISQVEKYALAIKRAGGNSPQSKRKWGGLVNKLSAVNNMAGASGSRVAD